MISIFGARRHLACRDGRARVRGNVRAPRRTAPMPDTCGGWACAVVRIGWNHLIPRWVSFLEPATPDQLSYLRFDTTPLPAAMRSETGVLLRWLKRFPADRSDDDELHRCATWLPACVGTDFDGAIPRANHENHHTDEQNPRGKHQLRPSLLGCRYQ